ncbi:hypothetical protein [Desulfitobacterium hafniense]|nr:hypothetical protein [Desulfitobacterium hafniense]EHL05826.1 hypothetical protein HMPREF0322_03586 [Desulfitobacterium hafniense DP7]KTE90451.1 hypothetical protein AT727_07615 [Desulfitobacterium hafniense]MEA5021742.1 hypothetical protein [Desulfitobacterium hafniense]CDX01047.1 Hypothetical protein DPCES_1160 [Desulfitobacterium hafniense]
MGDNTKLMSIVFSLEDPLITREYPSDIVLFRTFISAQTNTALWTPASGKSVFMTAWQASASVPVTIQLNRGSNPAFMSIMLTSTLATYGASFPSPVQLNQDEAISVTTSAAGTVNITLIGYEF